METIHRSQFPYLVCLRGCSHSVCISSVKISISFVAARFGGHKNHGAETKRFKVERHFDSASVHSHKDMTAAQFILTACQRLTLFFTTFLRTNFTVLIQHAYLTIQLSAHYWAVCPLTKLVVLSNCFALYCILLYFNAFSRFALGDGLS